MKSPSIAGVALAALLCLGSSMQTAKAAGMPPPAPSQSQTLLYPPAWVFTLPPSVLGRVWQTYDGQTLIQPRGMDSQSVAGYSVQTLPSIALAHTTDQHAQDGARAGADGPGSAWGPGLPPATFAAHPAGGWAYGRYQQRWGTYLYSAGAVFHNLVLRVVADCHLPRGSEPDACQRWTAGTLEHLLGRARGYAAQHPHGDRF